MEIQGQQVARAGQQQVALEIQNFQVEAGLRDLSGLLAAAGRLLARGRTEIMHLPTSEALHRLEAAQVDMAILLRRLGISLAVVRLEAGQAVRLADLETSDKREAVEK